MDDKFNELPKKISDLPWYFIRHIIALDNTNRENCYIEEDSCYESFVYVENEDGNQDENISCDNSGEGGITEIHTHDFIYTIYLCADDFLRQELSDKLVTCQYAVPFILPSAVEQEQPVNTIFHWDLKSISRTFSMEHRIYNKPLVNVEAPLVTWMRLGEETTQKSEVINKIFFDKSETFWH